jgi:hypothetical protein
MSQKKLDELIIKSLDNIESDRAVTNKLLTDLVLYMTKTGDSSHQTVGHIAAQYVETLQRSNEQLVKIAGLVQKKEGNKTGLSPFERDGLFDSIKEGK